MAPVAQGVPVSESSCFCLVISSRFSRVAEKLFHLERVMIEWRSHLAFKEPLGFLICREAWQWQEASAKDGVMRARVGRKSPA
jgi:hypothetical protein